MRSGRRAGPGPGGGGDTHPGHAAGGGGDTRPGHAAGGGGDNDPGGFPSDGREDGAAAASPFTHPPWTLGLVLVAGVVTLLFGVLVSPIWLLVGSPFVIALLLWLYVRVFVRPA